ncbi:MAG: hypothetical protein AABW58_02730 [Nanoarchaeota archaeon]
MTYTKPEKLSDQYFSVAINFGGSAPNTREIRKKVGVNEETIKGIYERDGSLRNLKIKGIGAQTMDFLEMILEKGYDEALRIAKEKGKKRLQEIV